VYIIDFDQATFNSSSEKWYLDEFLIEYLSFTSKFVDFRTNLENFNNEIPNEINKYTTEELEKIKTMLKEI
jgi:predicted Ser/Thr protein kinase